MRPGTWAWSFVLLGLCLGTAGCGGGSKSSDVDGLGGAIASTAPTAVPVLTYHYDNSRSGANTAETTLTAANVNSVSFGKVAFYPADGKVDAQPLYVPEEMIGGTTHNVLYVATEHDSAYALDADTGAVLWNVSLLGANETTSDARNCDLVVPETGVTATPVIDPMAGTHGVIFLVAASKDAAGKYFARVHALDLTTGAEMVGSPVTVQPTFPGTSLGSSLTGQLYFDAGQYLERAGLVLVNGTVVTTWASHCDYAPYTEWIVGYDESTMAQKAVLNLTPNGAEGAIWQGGAAPAVDASGNIYFLGANGSFDTVLDGLRFPTQGDYGNAFIKLSTNGNQLAVSDYFGIYDTDKESDEDLDLGSGGALLLPDISDAAGNVRHLAVGAGKDRNIYVVDRDNMGKFDADGDNIYQELERALGGEQYGLPAYWNNTLYYGAVRDVLRAFPITQAKLATRPSSNTSVKFPFPGVAPSVSSNGMANGIVWAVANASPAVLYAYDATNLNHKLYDSTQAANARDQFGVGNKFITPVITNGKVYVGTTNGVAVFGLLP